MFVYTLPSITAVLERSKNSGSISSVRRAKLAFSGIPKDRWLTTCDTLAITGFKLWCLDRASMWKLPGTWLTRKAIRIRWGLDKG